MNETINTGEVNSYIVQKTIGGWVVCYLNADRSIRNVDGGKVHKSRQNAYAKAKRLNERLAFEFWREDRNGNEIEGSRITTVGDSYFAALGSAIRVLDYRDLRSGTLRHRSLQ